MKKGERDRHGLRLVASMTEREARIRAAFDRLANAEFHTPGGFDALLERRDYLLQNYATVPGKTEPNEVAAAIQESIIKVLRDDAAVLQTKRLSRKKLEEWARRISLNAGLRDFMVHTENPGLPDANIQRYLGEVEDHLSRIALRRITRESVEIALGHLGIQIRDSDLTRLMVHEMNKGRITPIVLGIPNGHDPGKPFYVLLEGQTSFPARINMLLHCFGR